MEEQQLTTHEEGHHHKVMVSVLWVAAIILAGHAYLYYRVTHPSAQASAPSEAEPAIRERIGTLLAAFKSRQARELTSVSLTPPVVDPSK